MTQTAPSGGSCGPVSLTSIFTIVNQYIQPYTFYLIVWLITLSLTLGAGFLLGFLMRDRRSAKLAPKSGPSAGRHALIQARKSFFSYR